MTQYIIDKTAVVAEIDRMLKSVEHTSHCDEMTFNSGRWKALTSIKDFIDTLEVKKINSVWHDAIELPDETSLILLSLKDGNFILADEKTAYIRELVDKWCYVSDI